MGVAASRRLPSTAGITHGVGSVMVRSGIVLICDDALQRSGRAVARASSRLATFARAGSPKTFPMRGLLAQPKKHRRLQGQAPILTRVRTVSTLSIMSLTDEDKQWIAGGSCGAGCDHWVPEGSEGSGDPWAPEGARCSCSRCQQAISSSSVSGRVKTDTHEATRHVPFR
jgi:hypothetical protein